MNIQQAVQYPAGTIIKRISDHPERMYRVGPKLLESLYGDGRWGAFAMRIEDLAADDWVIKGGNL